LKEIVFKTKLKWHKITHWEYWHSATLYFPLCFYLFYLALKARSIGFFNAANPSIIYGGLTLEGKKDIETLLPKEHNPISILVKANTSKQAVLNLITENFRYPFIVKPNSGYRGKKVALINNEAEFLTYYNNANFDFLLQEYIAYENEIGLFYCRKPNEFNGTITGIVYKVPITVIGDGKSTIGDLVFYNYRYHNQYETLFTDNEALKNTILPFGEKYLLSTIGNHCRGSMFLDFSDKITPQLTDTINNYCKQINGFYFGRFDIKFNSWEELEQGKNFKVIELNGAGAEPTHIFDPKHSYFFALKEMAKHWKLMADIANVNKKLGAKYLGFWSAIKLRKKWKN